MLTEREHESSLRDETEQISLLEDATSSNELVNMLSDPEIPNLLPDSITDGIVNRKSFVYSSQKYSSASVGLELSDQPNLTFCDPLDNSAQHCHSGDKKKSDVFPGLADNSDSMAKPQGKIKQGRGRPRKQSNKSTVSLLTAKSLDKTQVTQEDGSGKADVEGMPADSIHLEEGEHPKKKRGRPPKLKADSLCARTVPYGWKSKTREQRLADFKLLLSQCEDVEPERNASLLESVTQQSSSNNSSHPAQSQSVTTSESCVHLESVADQEIALSDNRDFQRPHVSPDSGISAGGSPAHLVASPHQALQPSAVPDDTVADGPPTLEPMVMSNTSKSSHSLNNITSAMICDSNSQSMYNKCQSSHKTLAASNRLCDQTDSQRPVVSNNGRATVIQNETSDTQLLEKNSRTSANVPDPSMKRKRGRPKGSVQSLKTAKDTDSTNLNSGVINQGNNVEFQRSPLQMPFVSSPYMNPYPYGLPQSSTSQMADYLDNIFERFQAEQSGLNKNEVSKESHSEKCEPKSTKQKQKPVGDSDTHKRHRLSNNLKLSKNAKSAIKSKLSRALKLSGFSRDISFKRKRGRPRIHPLPVEKLKRGRGRPRKYPISVQSPTGVLDDTLSSKKPSSYKTSHHKLKSKDSKQYVPNVIHKSSSSGMKFCHPVSNVSFKSQSNNKEAQDFNIGPPVLFSEESLSPEVLSMSKPGDEFDKLMHSLQPVHARISAKFHRRLSEMDRTEDTVSSDSDGEFAMSQSTSDLSKDNKKLVPNIRKAKLQVTPPKKRGRKKKVVSEHSELYVDPECQTEFRLPPSAYAFHKMSPYSAGTSSKDTQSEKISTVLNSHSQVCKSPAVVQESEPLRGFPRSPPAHLNISPGSQAGSTVSALSRQSEEMHESRRKNKKKKSKHFKSKHKNIVDPVFVAEVENLACDIEHIKLSDIQQQQSTYSHVTDSPMSVPVVFHFGKRTSKALLKATSRQQKSFKSKSALNQLKKARKRRQIQDGLDMARKKHILLKKKTRMSDQLEVKRRPRGRPRKKRWDISVTKSTEKGRN